MEDLIHKLLGDQSYKEDLKSLGDMCCVWTQNDCLKFSEYEVLQKIKNLLEEQHKNKESIDSTLDLLHLFDKITNYPIGIKKCVEVGMHWTLLAVAEFSCQQYHSKNNKCYDQVVECALQILATILLSKYGPSQGQLKHQYYNEEIQNLPGMTLRVSTRISWICWQKLVENWWSKEENRVQLYLTYQPLQKRKKLLKAVQKKMIYENCWSA
eukprot:TRINITY_DN9194_c0_g1_i2.p1 TRINITY_DN9194_c0_g1~~TRINITY_DN9194_c0_g1_i2.p1  ORF type:complete len:211 (-),score=18.09 TRINITY_DN9194_c0_g1_i2:258-890(-)